MLIWTYDSFSAIFFSLHSALASAHNPVLLGLQTWKDKGPTDYDTQDSDVDSGRESAILHQGVIIQRKGLDSCADDSGQVPGKD